jgi:hypothetical protein
LFLSFSKDERVFFQILLETLKIWKSKNVSSQKAKQKIHDKFMSEITCFETVLKCDYCLKTASIGMQSCIFIATSICFFRNYFR